MLDTLISSKTRLKLLMRLFLNPENSAHLRGLAEDFGESTNAVRVELNRFEEAGMIRAVTQGNKKLYQANNEHPLFPDLNNIILKYVGVDRIIETIIGRLGNVVQIYLGGDYAHGRDSGIIDLLVVGDINQNYLMNLIMKAEKMISKKIRFLIYSSEEWRQHQLEVEDKERILLLWEKP